MIAKITMGIASGLVWTVAITAASFAIGVALGLILCAMRLSKIRIIQWVALTYILIFRSVPPLLWVFLFYFGLGSGFISISAFEAATLGLGLITAANMAEIFRGSLSAIHDGQWEAANALGLPSFSIQRYIIAPQLLRIALPSAAGYAVALLKDSAIASTVGVTDISFNAAYLARSTYQGLEVFAIAGLFYIALSIPIAVFARLTDKGLRARVAQ